MPNIFKLSHLLSLLPSLSSALVLGTVTLLFLLSGCRDTPEIPTENPPSPPTIRAADLSSLPEMEAAGFVYHDEAGNAGNVLDILKAKGMNMVRLRLWHTPTTTRSGWAEVKDMSDRIHAAGLGVWISLHYSDTWADPSQQATPMAWQGLDQTTLEDSVRAYTQKVVECMAPEIIQIGNEINNGFLYPSGTDTRPSERMALMIAGTEGARIASPDVQVMFHYAGFELSMSFIYEFKALDYDLIGLSYYPLWHGKEIDDLQGTIRRIHEVFNDRVVIAETAYPHTLAWNDNTNNIVGLEEQLILPEYPATPQGQSNFMERIRTITEAEFVKGFCYWGGEWVASDGPQSTNGSPWENQALFDFQGKLLPVADVFRE